VYVAISYSFFQLGLIVESITLYFVFNEILVATSNKYRRTKKENLMKIQDKIRVIPIIHCLSVLDLGEGVDQSFYCSILQHRQAMNFMGWSSGGQNGQRSVPLHHNHNPQKRPYPIRVSRSGNV